MAEENEGQDTQEQVTEGDSGEAQQEQDRIAALEARLAEAEGKVTRYEGELRHVHTNLNKISAANYARAVKAVRAEMKAAVESGDTARFDAADRQLDELQKQDPQVNGQATNVQPNPAFEQWHKRNSWYGQDPELSVYAETIGAGLTARGYTGQALYDQIEREVKERFPRKFAPRTPVGPEGGPSLRRPAANAKKTEADLPPDAIKAADKFIAQGVFKDRAEYAAEYFAEIEKRSPRAA